MKHYLSFLLFLFFLIPGLSSQSNLESINSVYNDALTHWDLYTGDDEGTLHITWEMRGDITDWTFEIGDISGTIRQQWLNDDTSYELSVNEGGMVEMKQKWRNDYSEWIIKGDDIQFVWMSAQFDDGNDWGCEIDGVGKFYIYTEYVDDPRDWIVEDYMPEEYLPEKLACVFITLIRAIQNFH